MVSTFQGSRHRIYGSKRIIVFIEVLVCVAMVFLVYNFPAMVAMPIRVVPMRQMSSSRSSSDVDDSSVTVSSPKMSVSVNQSLLPGSWTSRLQLSSTTVIEYNRTEPNVKSESDDDHVTTATQLTTALTRLPNVCNNSVKLMPRGSMPVIALASLPGSGNTWLRYLIESVTGMYTGSIYTDKRLIEGGFLGESCKPFSGRTVVVKMHSIESPSKIQKTIFLVRNLYEAMQSQFSLEISRGHTGIVKETRYKTKEWPKCVSNMLRKWENLIGVVTTHFGSKDKLLVVHYQDLKKDLAKELTRIVDFLGLRLDEERLRCTVQNVEGNFHRPKRILSFDPFQGALRTRVQQVIVQTQNVWKTHNFTQLRVS